MNKIARGAHVFLDDFVEAMASGKNVKLPKNLDDIIDDNVSDLEDIADEEKVAVSNDKPTTYADACERLHCPRYQRSCNAFRLFDDATWYSDGEDVKRYNIKCLGTDSSPCSACSNKEVTRVKAGLYTPSPSPTKPKKFAFDAEGFNKADYKGEEDTPKKVSADGCKWCKWEPCIMENDMVNDDAKDLVDNLIAQEKQGIALTYKNYRFALYRFYARALGYKGKRVLLPVCVQLFIDNNFDEKGKECTGFKSK